jgi:hypothetical protein
MAKIPYSINIPSPPLTFADKEDEVAYLSSLTVGLRGAITRLIEEINGKLELINHKSYSYTLADSGLANSELTITHNLGSIPSHYIWNIASNGVVYDSRRVDWTTTQIFVKCSAANQSLKILVFL